MPQHPVHRVIAVCTAVLTVVCCAAYLSTTRRHGPDGDRSAAIPFVVPIDSSSTDPSLNSLINTQSSQLSDVSGHHWYGMCGSAHFFRVQYSKDSDIQQIVTTNGFTPVEKPYWESGMVGGPKWNSLASDWHQIPSSVAAYSRSERGYYFYLFVNNETRTAYLEVDYGMP